MTPIPPDARALTLLQPEPKFIEVGAQAIITRKQSTDYRGPLVIHAATAYPMVLWPEVALKEADLVNVLDSHGVEFRTYERAGRTGYRPILPLGAVVAVVDLVDVVPIVGPDCAEWPPTRVLRHGHRGAGPRLAVVDCLGRSDLGAFGYPRTWGVPTSVADQEPFGGFTPGRYAWLLDNVRPVDPPIPAKGRQGLWRWNR